MARGTRRPGSDTLPTLNAEALRSRVAAGPSGSDLDLYDLVGPGGGTGHTEAGEAGRFAQPSGE